jgi:hypothetical protein
MWKWKSTWKKTFRKLYGIFFHKNHGWGPCETPMVLSVTYIFLIRFVQSVIFRWVVQFLEAVWWHLSYPTPVSHTYSIYMHTNGYLFAVEPWKAIVNTFLCYGAAIMLFKDLYLVQPRHALDFPKFPHSWDSMTWIPEMREWWEIN